MTEIYPVSENRDLLTVSRQQAQKYEEYEKWYKNESGLFTALGKFTGELGGAGLSRITVANQQLRLRSSVENLRVPCHRVVEFHATTILTGPPDEMLKVEAPDTGKPDTEEAPLKAAILKVWERSNLRASLKVAKRYLARDGQMFVKVVEPENKDYCYLQFIPARDVTDYETDERGNVTYIRTDVPDVRQADGSRTRKVWITEIWRKRSSGKDNEPGYALFAESERGSTLDSVPSETRIAEDRSTKRVELGSEAGYAFDFVPFVVINAQDTGEKRPEPVYAHGLHLIAWINREVTRVSDLFLRFNKPFKVIGGIGNDPQGRPMPGVNPGALKGQSLDTYHNGSNEGGAHIVPFGGSRGYVLSREQEDISLEGIAVASLPGNANMYDATPNIDYGAAREWIQGHLREIYEELPELLYYAIESRANQSGAALRTLIAGALSRAEEMQENLIAGLLKADAMALSVSQAAGFAGFSEGEIGTYEDGSFDHEIEPPEILPLTEEEKQRAEQGKLSNAQTLISLLTQVGVSEEKRREIVLSELGYEELVRDAENGSGAPEAASEGNVSPDELAASQRALVARLSGQQTTGGGGSPGGG